MTAPLQEPLDFWVGTILPATSVQTTLTSPELFASLPTYLAPDRFVPAQIVDENTGRYEVVRIVGANGTTTATVQRGAEGTDPQPWDQPTTIRCAARSRDLVKTYSDKSKVPLDLPVGARTVQADEQILRTMTRKQGALPAMHCSPGDLVKSLGQGAYLPAGIEPRMFAIPVGPIVTDGGGTVYVYYDGKGTPVSNLWNMATELGLQSYPAYISALFAQGILTGSDASWTGLCTPTVQGGSSCAVRCFWPNGTPFAYRSVKFSLLGIGA